MSDELTLAEREPRAIGMVPAPEEEQEEEKALYVASQWQLMWWKFKKHRLANVAAPVLIILYLSALFADFISPTTDGAFHQLQGRAAPIDPHL